MTHITKFKFRPDEDAVKQLQRLGKRIRIARIRRKFRQRDLADMSGLSLSTIRAIERGEPTTNVGALFHVLWMLRLSQEVELIADPGLDREGLTLSLSTENMRVYVPTKYDDNF